MFLLHPNDLILAYGKRPTDSSLAVVGLQSGMAEGCARLRGDVTLGLGMAIWLVPGGR